MIVNDSDKRDTINHIARKSERWSFAVSARDCTEGHLLGFDNLVRRRSLELSAKNHVPEAAGDTEAIVKVSEVVLKVIFLELFIVEREAEPLLALIS